MDLLTFAAAIYCLFHVYNRSDLARGLREWTARHAPRWFTYATSCAFCATFWVSLSLWVLDLLSIDLVTLLALPVINLVLDLAVRALIRANEPPLISVSSTSPTTITTGGQVTVIAASDMRAGELVAVVPHGDGVKIPESMRAMVAGYVPFNPQWEWAPSGWEYTHRDSSPYRTSGVIRWWPGGLVGRCVRVDRGVNAGRTGKIVDGEGPSFLRTTNTPISWVYIIEPVNTVGVRIQAATVDCTLLGDDAPFNPLAHEQTK